MADGRNEVRYEDAAEMRTGISGWCCKTCGRFWGDDEHMARLCHATVRPCRTCDAGTCARGWVTCEACRSSEAEAEARWRALEVVDWDGETPLCEWDGDRYYFDAGSIADAIGERLRGGGKIEDFRLVTCRPARPPSFDVALADFLSGWLPEDFGPGCDFAAIDKAVNDRIAARGVPAWEPTGEAVRVSSLPLPEPEGD